MDLMLIEVEVKDFVINQPNISSNEKARRITKTLDFITAIYNKYEEITTAPEAYNILFEECPLVKNE